MELKMMFYLSNVAIAVNISQPSVRIGGGLHALIHIFFLHGGSKSAEPHWDLKFYLICLHPRKWRTRAPVFNRGSGGGARGCGFEERVGVHARTGWVRFT